MNLEQTRQLGIEFERRVLTLIPNTEFMEKLDTETIYSYLNQYLDKYIHDIYRSLDSIPSGTKLSYHIDSILQSMLSTWNIPVQANLDSSVNTNQTNNTLIVDTSRSYTFTLPENWYMYVRSVSKVTSTVSYLNNDSNKSVIIPNKLMSQNEVWKIVETPYDSLRILRQPVVVLNETLDGEDGDRVPTMTVIFDRYTKVAGIRVLYYKQPAYFDIMESTCCELPMEAFDDLVSGAVNLYVDYAAGAEADKRRRAQEALEQQRRQEEQLRRNRDQQ